MKNLTGWRHKLGQAARFVSNDMWDVELSSLSRLPRFGVKALRVIQLVFRGFREDECPLHASALTFNTLMSIVPILALSLALARGLGDAETAKEKLRSAISDWTQTFAPAETVVDNADGRAKPDAHDELLTHHEQTRKNGAADQSLQPSALAREIDTLVAEGFKRIDKISFGALGGIGLVLLLWMAIQVLGRVEASFNRVWGVTEGRSLWRKSTDYLSILFVLPVLVVAASSLPVANFVTRFLDGEAATVVRTLLASGFLKAATVLFMSILCFTFILMFMPNTRVAFVPALAGGTITALLFLGWLRACAALQVGVAKWGSIYGSFAVVPIILAWVYISWQIIFFGAEVAFAVQNCATYRMEQGARKANARARILLAISIAGAAAQAMINGDRPFDISAFARKRRVPVRFLGDVVSDMVHSGLLAELSGQQGAYVLLRSPESLTVSQVIATIMQAGVEPRDLGLNSLEPGVLAIDEKVTHGLDTCVSGLSIKDLIQDGNAA